MARNRTSTKLLVIHCAATTPRMDIGVRTIHKWHLLRGIFSHRGLSGYHYVIRRSGTIELGRELREIGSHALGYNDASVGICLVGGINRQGEAEDNFKPEQFESLERLIKVMRRIFPAAVIVPHNMLANKACPSFDVYAWQAKASTETDELKAKALIATWEQDE